MKFAERQKLIYGFTFLPHVVYVESYVVYYHWYAEKIHDSLIRTI